MNSPSAFKKKWIKPRDRRTVKPAYSIVTACLAVVTAVFLYRWSGEGTAQSKGGLDGPAGVQSNTGKDAGSTPPRSDPSAPRKQAALALLGPPGEWRARLAKEDKVALLQAIYLAASSDLSGTLSWLEKADIAVYDRTIYEHLISGAKMKPSLLAMQLKEHLTGERLHFAAVALLTKAMKGDLTGVLTLYDSLRGAISKDEMGRLLLSNFSASPENLRVLLATGNDEAVGILAAATVGDKACPKELRSQILTAALSSPAVDEEQIQKIADRFAIAQLDSAVDYLAALPQGKRGGVVGHRIVAHWAATNPEKAGAWLNEQARSPLRDFYTAGYVSGVRSIDPDAAKKWEATIIGATGKSGE